MVGDGGDGGSPTINVGACDLNLDLGMKSKFRSHEFSIGIPEFCLSPPVIGLLVDHPHDVCTEDKRCKTSLCCFKL